MKALNNKILIEYARTWVGTPWHHNQCCKGVGVDCIRFTNDCYNYLGVDTGDIKHYSKTIRDNTLLPHLDSLISTTRVDHLDILPGQLLVFKTKNIPRHVGIATDSGMFIHADNFRAIMKVHEQALGKWQDRIVARFEFGLV